MVKKNLKKYKNGDRLKVKVLEIKSDQQKVRVGLKTNERGPFCFFL